MSPLYEVLEDILVTGFRVDRGRLGPDTAFRDLYFDSLTMVNLSIALNDRLDFAVDDEDVFQQTTVGDLVKLLEDLEEAAR